jgi:hypothetical protein
LAQFAKIVEAGPDREKDGIVRWRRVDLKRAIAERFGVDFHPRVASPLADTSGGVRANIPWHIVRFW